MCFSEGEAHGISAFFGNILYWNLLTAKANSLLNTFGDSVISFGRIILNFLLSIIKVFSHYKQKPLEGGCCSCEFSPVSFETCTISRRLTNYLCCYCCLLPSFSCCFCYSIYVVVSENSDKSFFLSYNFILFTKHNFRIFKKSFVSKKWFN